MIKLDPETKAKWLEALRSGRYKQGKNYLKRIITLPDGQQEVRHCCMGVYCEIKGFQESTSKKDHSVFSFKSDELDEDGDAVTVHDKFLSQPFFLHTLAVYLATSNDLEGLSFVEIADWIEANL